jgi:hypothetical protein
MFWLQTIRTVILVALLIVCMGNTAEAGYVDSVRTVSLHRSYSFDPVAYTDTPSCTIPFTRVGNLIIIKAKADTTEGNFILDTGAPNLVLNITYFRNYPSTTLADAEKGGVTGPVSAVVQTTIKAFTFGTLNYDAIEADLTNLGHIENAKGVKILGLIGMQFFKQCEMIIDYEKSVIHLHLISRKEQSTYDHDLLKDTSTYNTIPIELYNDKILASTEMAGKKLKLMVDCAAETSVLDSRLPNKIFENITITGRVILKGSGSQRVEAIQGSINTLKIGDIDWRGVPVIVTNLEKTCVSYESCLNGILGFDFFSMQKVGFNFVKRKMYIWK